MQPLLSLPGRAGSTSLSPALPTSDAELQIVSEFPPAARAEAIIEVMNWAAFSGPPTARAAEAK
jgi:hypothetical protein